MLEIDGSKYSGSGSIIRQAVALAALTGTAIHVINARVKRPKPGLRRQHVQAVEAIRQLVEGSAEGVVQGALDFVFRPSQLQRKERYCWDIGSAGSTTALALAVLPVLAFARRPISIEFRGGVFQDFAPSFFHFERVLLHLLNRMGFSATMRMERPGYVPTGQGIWHMTALPTKKTLQALDLHEAGEVTQCWGIALSSRLRERSVSHRMADAAKRSLSDAGYCADIELVYDESALQAGAGLAVFADTSSGARLGADRAGALRRSAEAIGKFVAHRLIEDLHTGATLDRYASDQIIPFTALAAGESRLRIPRVTEHIETSAWLCRKLLGAEVALDYPMLKVKGIGFRSQ